MNNKISIRCSKCSKPITIILVFEEGRKELFSRIKDNLPEGWSMVNNDFYCEECCKKIAEPIMRLT